MAKKVQADDKKKSKNTCEGKVYNKAVDGNIKSPSPRPQRKTPSSPDKLVPGRSPDPGVRYSFEDELTFSPRLNSLSMKMVSGVNRTSIIERKQEKKGEDTAIMFAFKPHLSNNSTKIVAKMKTCFWERQNKVVQRRLEMVEQGPSTIHPNLRQSSKDNSEECKKKTCGGVLTSLSEQTCTLNIAFKHRKKRSKSKSPYQKSVDLLLALKKEDMPLHVVEDTEKCGCSNKKNENPKLISHRNLVQITKHIKNNRHYKNHVNNADTSPSKPENDPTNRDKLPSTNLERKVQLITSATKVLLDNDNITVAIEDNTSQQHVASKSKNKSCSTLLHKHQLLEKRLEKRKSLEKMINSTSKRPGVTLEKDGNKNNDKKHGRTFTYPLGKEKTDEMDAIHQNLLKMKKVAGQAIKKKKVFVCNGPYSSLRVALRRRGWIEKHFKVGDPPLLKQLVNVTKTSEEEGEEETKNSPEVKDNTEESDRNSFLCDNQYGIMSRIVRKSMPILLWTLRRDDIDFRFLHKDQIVNHFLSATSFTTKAGLCMTLNNLRYFDDVSALLFFPRCYRLCCDEEKEEFVEDYQISALQSILKLVIEKHEEWESYLEGEKENDQIVADSLADDDGKSIVDVQEKEVLNTDVFCLAFKMSHDYLESKQHVDIEEAFCPIDDMQKKGNWIQILDYFKKLALQGGVIAGASVYVDECKRILSKMEVYHPQLKIDGYHNIWILKPGAKSRGRGIEIMNVLSDILSLSSDTVSKKENRWVIQKYIEKPYLVYRTKFDIRQWFLVTDWNPLVLWFYKDCYVRFCGQEFQLDKFDPQVHLSNNSVQKNYKNGERSEHLPESNMWSSDEFKKFLKSQDQEHVWDDIIYPGMKKAITAVLISSHESLEFRKNSFELYGADFMIGEDLQPWLIEINSSPALGPSTPVTERLCRNVLEDTLKVVLDRRDNKECDTGQFELAYKRPFIPMPTYVGCSISVDGIPLRPLNFGKKKIVIPKVPFKSPIPSKASDNSLSGESAVSCAHAQSDDSLKISNEKKNSETSRSGSSSPNHLPIVKYSKKEDPSKDVTTTTTATTATKRNKPLFTNNVKNTKTPKISKSKSNHENTEILRALIEPRLCTFPLDTCANVEAFKEIRNCHPSYRFSKPVKMENEDGVESEKEREKMCSSLELFQPYKMRYRNMSNIHTTSLSRQFSLMTPEDVNRLKRRRWNAVET